MLTTTQGRIGGWHLHATRMECWQLILEIQVPALLTSCNALRQRKICFIKTWRPLLTVVIIFSAYRRAYRRQHMDRQGRATAVPNWWLWKLQKILVTSSSQVEMEIKMIWNHKHMRCYTWCVMRFWLAIIPVHIASDHPDDYQGRLGIFGKLHYPLFIHAWKAAYFFKGRPTQCVKNCRVLIYM